MTEMLEGFAPKAPLSEMELARLRYIVRCVHCGAVPTEQRTEDGKVITRQVLNQAGALIDLPYVITPHRATCPGATLIGRPAKKEDKPRVHKTTDAGPCAVCGTPMVAARNRLRRACGSTCRNRLKVLRAKGELPRPPTVTACLWCAVPMESGKGGQRRYCSEPCRSRAARAAKKQGAVR